MILRFFRKIKERWNKFVYDHIIRQAPDDWDI
jgi:hypothetical protein